MSFGERGIDATAIRRVEPRLVRAVPPLEQARVFQELEQVRRARGRRQPCVAAGGDGALAAVAQVLKRADQFRLMFSL